MHIWKITSFMVLFVAFFVLAFSQASMKGASTSYSGEHRDQMNREVSLQEQSMYGLIVKLTVVPGKRDEMIGILKESAAEMPGCLSYVVAKDSADEDTVWVTEVWESAASHDASLSLPSVKAAAARGKALIAGFEKIAVTAPVWGSSLSPTGSH